uniref:BcDNA.LD28419 (inferred by orthology to a D. melanogaster protein) n=1 Tax=Strongyloides venezuelensis TaxID=75913 RepID=A0A0K0EV91_STRVS
MSSDSMNKSEENKSLAILTIILTLDLIAFASILPLFPSIFEKYSATNDNDLLLKYMNTSITLLQDFLHIPSDSRYNLVLYGGSLGFLYSLLQFFCFPLFGGLSDIYGRKPILIVSIIGSLISYILWYFADSFTIFFLSRVVGGLTKASTSISIAISADICDNKKKVKGIALIGIAFSVGFIIGPLIGAILSATTMNTRKDIPVAIFSIFTSVIELVIVILFLKETLLIRKQKINHIYQKVVLYINPKSLFNYEAIVGSISKKRHENIKNLSRYYFMYLFFYSGLEFTLSFLTHQKFSFTSSDQGKMYFYIGILMIILQGGILRRIPSERQLKTVLIAILIIIPSYVVIAFSNNMVGFGIGLTMYSIASAFIVPCLTSMVAEMCSDSNKGTTMGVFRSLGALARAIGPIFTSSIFWLMGSTFCYCFIGILFIFPLIGLYQFNAAATENLKEQVLEEKSEMLKNKTSP